MSGAVDLEACWSRTSRSPGTNKYGVCRCGKCRACGHHKHTAIHGPFVDEPPGSKPYGHEFQTPGEQGETE